MNIFENGQSSTVEEILESRDWRNQQQKRLLSEFPDQTLVAFKLNIPGRVKTSPAILEIFQAGWDILEKQALESFLYLERKSGPEGFLLIEENPMQVKQEMVKVEEESTLGRFYDLDVFERTGNQISRSQLKLPQRKCLVCEHSAKTCAREQRHSAEEITEAMSKIYEQTK